MKTRTAMMIMLLVGLATSTTLASSTARPVEPGTQPGETQVPARTKLRKAMAANTGAGASCRIATANVDPQPTGPGSLDTTFDPTAAGTKAGIEADSVPPFVGALLRQPDGKLVIGGRFDRVNGVVRRGLARLNPDGTLDPSFQLACTNDLTVIALAQPPDQKLLFLGRRNQTGEPLAPFTGLVRLNPDGSFDSTFSNYWSGAWVPYLRCLALQADGKILVGGEFTEPSRGVTRFHPDGRLDETFQPPPFPAYDGAGVNTLVPQADDKILVGGDWGIGLVRLHPDGTEDTSFHPAPNVGSEPLGVLLLPDGRIIVGRKMCCGECGALVRLQPDGGLDTNFAAELDLQPLTLLHQPDGRLLVTGMVNDLGRDAGIYLLRPDGSREARFQTAVHADLGLPRISAMLMQPDGRILIGGWFSSVNQVPVDAVARLSGEILPVLRALGASADGVHLELAGAPHGIHWLEASVNLTDWATVACLTNSAAGTCQYQGPAPDESRCRFYRAKTTAALGSDSIGRTQIEHRWVGPAVQSARTRPRGRHGPVRSSSRRIGRWWHGGGA